MPCRTPWVASRAVAGGMSKPGQQAQLAAAPDYASAPTPAPGRAAVGRGAAEAPKGRHEPVQPPEAGARPAAAVGWGAGAAKAGRCSPLGPEVAAAVATNSTIILTCAARRLPPARRPGPPPCMRARSARPSYLDWRAASRS